MIGNIRYKEIFKYMNNIVNYKNMRFTVVTPNLIRIEYSKSNVFVDEKTLFAQNRNMAEVSFKVEQDDEKIVIETKAIKLTYKNDNKPISEDNLFALIKTENVDTIWKAHMKNKENLKGTLATLDGVEGFVDLPDGLLSKDGWYVIDDSGLPIFKDHWIANRPKESEMDWYLFGYGKNYKGALKDLAYISGEMALPRKYIFGSWYSRWWPYTDKEFMEIVDEYDANDFPLDILVMDMEQ